MLAGRGDKNEKNSANQSMVFQPGARAEESGGGSGGGGRGHRKRSSHRVLSSPLLSLSTLPPLLPALSLETAG